MTRNTLLPIALATLLLGGACTAKAPAPASPDGFVAFWSTFRAALLRGDMNGVAAMARFPVLAGFESDQDHPKKIDRGSFPSFLRAELRCPLGDAATADGTTLASIRQKGRPDGRYDFHDRNRATVGNFSFDHMPAGWRLTGLNYGDVSDYQARLKGQC